MSKGIGKGKSGTRKYGRNKIKCERYRKEHRYEKNKIRKLSAMIKNLSPENNMRKQTEKRIEELNDLRFKEIK